MSLRVTRCPKCSSTFNTNAHIRAVASGLVRCGACLFVFKAEDHFTEAPEEADSTESPEEVFLSEETDFFNPSHFLRRNELSTTAEEPPELDPAAESNVQDFEANEEDIEQVEVDEPGNSTLESEAITFDAIRDPVETQLQPDAESELPSDSEALFDQEIAQAFTLAPENQAAAGAEDLVESDAEASRLVELDGLPEQEETFSFQVVDAAEDEPEEEPEEVPEAITAEPHAEVRPDDDSPLDFAEERESPTLDARESSTQHSADDRSDVDDSWTTVAPSITEFDAEATNLEPDLADTTDSSYHDESWESATSTIAEVDAEAVRLEPLTVDAAERADQEAVATQDIEEFNEPEKPRVGLDEWDEEQALEELSEGQLAALNTVGEAVRIAQGQRSRTTRNLLIAVAVLVATGLVLGLLMWQRMPSLSQSNQFRPYYVTVCDIVGCELPAFSNVGEIRSESLQVSSHPTIEGALLFSIVFRNQARFPQPFPLLNLSFSDFDQRPIAQRDFGPAEYLPESLRQFELMPVNTPIQITLELVDPGDDAINYNISFSPP